MSEGGGVRRGEGEVIEAAGGREVGWCWWG